MKISNQLKLFFLSPYVIGLFITFAVVFFLPNNFPKYEITLINQEIISNSKRVFFNDIDGDGKSEKFVLMIGEFGNASYILYNGDGALVDRFNLTTKFSLYRNAWFQDANKNGTKEFYILTKSNDSIFLNIHEHLNENKVFQNKIFVDKIGEHKGTFNFSSIGVNNYFSNGNTTEEIIFSINVGYGLHPRSLYKYNSLTKKVLKSQHLTNTIGIKTVIDLNDDGKNEYLINSSATSNNLDTLFSKRSDYSTWLTVLDNDLKYLFTPIEIKSKGRLKSIYFNEEEETSLIYLFQSLDKKESSKIIKVNLHGEITKEVLLNGDSYRTILKINNQTFTVYNFLNGHLSFYDNNLNLIKTEKIKENLGFIFYYDIDRDNKKELIAISPIENKLYIYRNDLKSYIKTDRPIDFVKGFGINEVSLNEHHFFFSHNNKISHYKYGKNKYYIFKYLSYVLLYILVLGVVYLIIRGQEFREKKKRSIEKEILDLQLKNIKNQVDSHFVFNALNTISEMSLSGNKLELDNFIIGYSKFMRTTLEHSDKISTTVKEELDYVENFIKLQQLKLKDRFSYKIDIQKDVSESIKIPKHCIYTHVENALKYGLPTKGKGLLLITLNTDNQYFTIKIQDNGVGLNKTKRSEEKGTGRGLKIMTKIFELYKERFKADIKYSIENIYKKEQILGVLVTIRLRQNPLKK